MHALFCTFVPVSTLLNIGLGEEKDRKKERRRNHRAKI